MMGYPKFFLFAFFPCIFCKIKISPKNLKISIVTDGYNVLFIGLPPLTVAFHSRNDLITDLVLLSLFMRDNGRSG